MDSSSALYTGQQLATWCDTYLQVDRYQDYCPNGLQIDAGQPIAKLLTGVTACDALIETAIEQQAQAILVHHGYFWKGEPAVLTGVKGQRIAKLMQHGISLLAYHLPLDDHPTIGNNALLAKRLNLHITGRLYPNNVSDVGNMAQCAPMTVQQLAHQIDTQLQRQPLHIKAGNHTIETVALCTGAAQDMIVQAADRGAQAFISGEISERTTHLARELGVDYFAAGHHATERDGVRALGEQLADQFGLSVQFADVDNPA